MVKISDTFTGEFLYLKVITIVFIGFPIFAMIMSGELLSVPLFFLLCGLYYRFVRYPKYREVFVDSKNIYLQKPTSLMLHKIPRDEIKEIKYYRSRYGLIFFDSYGEKNSIQFFSTQDENRHIFLNFLEEEEAKRPQRVLKGIRRKYRRFRHSRNK